MGNKPNPGSGPSPEPQRDTPEKGRTLPSRNDQREPRLPHERDESSDSHPGTQDERIQQAAVDLANGLQDTGRQPVTTELARREFLPSTDQKREFKKNTNS